MDDNILLSRLLRLRKQMLTYAASYSDLALVHPDYQASALNLLHYLSLRSHEIRDVQRALIERGLTSLGILEAHTLATLNSVITALQCLMQIPREMPVPPAPVTIASSDAIRERHTRRLFGASPVHREAYIMVTMPSEAAENTVLIEQLLHAGMNIMRINCAHDNADVWQQMLANLRLAEARTGKSCKVQLDLAGAKLRTGTLAAKPLWLYAGDILVLTRADVPGQDGERDAIGVQRSPAQIHCTLEAAFQAVRVGQPVWLDDGKIGGVAEQVTADAIHVRIQHTPPEGGKLRAEKGINFPETTFALAALTTKDITDLTIMAGKVDMVALSFVRSPEDVLQLQTHLQRLGIADTGIVLKIENRSAFAHLPAILLAAMRSTNIGVMIARGDLAVEVGFERLSEVQEEILWLCEAAHVPVIWATQLLEGLAKKGIPSRAEVTDAAMSIRAECAMLNKGKNIVETVRFLDGILQRMESHYHKRRLMMRPLHVCSAAGVAH